MTKVVRYYVHSGERIHFPDNSVGVMLRGLDVDSQTLARVYVPSEIAGTIVDRWNKDGCRVMDMTLNDKTVQITQAMKDGEEGLLNPKEYLAPFETAQVVSAFTQVGSNKQEVLNDISSIDLGIKWTTIQGKYKGVAATVVVPSSQVKRYNEIREGNSKAFKGWDLVLTGGLAKAVRGSFMGYGANFVRPSLHR